jgi:hypothetical protein
MNRKPFTTDTTFLLVDGTPDGRRCRVTLEWDPEAPLEVLFRFPQPNPVWLVSRDLLAEGLTCHTGLGDVEVSPYSPDGVQLTLCGKQFTVVLRVSRRMLRRFLESTFVACPAGQEVCQELDRELQELLG